jgi:hypothetical protein
MNRNNDYPERILSLLENACEPLDVEKIRVETGIGNWNTCLKHCLEMLVNKKIRGQKTSKSWVFWANNKAFFAGSTVAERK